MQLHMSRIGAGSYVGLPMFAEDLQGSFSHPTSARNYSQERQYRQQSCWHTVW
jgi:hypothetical protein